MNVVSLHPNPPREPASVHVLGHLLGSTPDGQWTVVDESGATWTCRRAASCLLRPEPGDTVMVSGPDRYRLYLIAVVEQAQASASCIEAAGDVTLTAMSGGRVSLESSSELHLHGGRMLNMTASKATCAVTEMDFCAQSAEASVGHLRFFGKALESVVDRMVHMARTALRIVDETDQVRAGHVDHEARDTVRVHGRHTVITGQDLVKVDSAQIHMG